MHARWLCRFHGDLGGGARLRNWNVKMLDQQFLIKKARFVCLSHLTSRAHSLTSDRDVCVAETEELVERGAVEAQETALHRPTQVSPYSQE